jgi:hypothetical protein
LRDQGPAHPAQPRRQAALAQDRLDRCCVWGFFFFEIKRKINKKRGRDGREKCRHRFYAALQTASADKTDCR